MENHRALLIFQGLQTFPAIFLVDGQEPLEGKASGGQSADGQGVHSRAAAGDGENFHTVFRTKTNQVLAGVRDGGSAGVRYQSAGLASQQPLQNRLSGRDMIVLMIAHQRLLDFKVVQQLHGYPCVLRCNEIHLLQRFNGTRREVSQIADGGGDQIKRAAHGVSS